MNIFVSFSVLRRILSFLSRAEIDTSEAKKLRKLIYSAVKIISGVRQKFHSLPILRDTVQRFFFKN